MTLVVARPCKTIGCTNVAMARDPWCFECQTEGEVDEGNQTSELYIGERIVTRREELRMNQRELADVLMLHSSVLSTWERDLRPVPLYRVEQLARALRTDAGTLTEQRYIAGKVSVRAVPDQVLLWDISCLVCGFEVHAQWTERRARLERQAARFRCGQCRSVVLITQADVGFQHGQTQGHIARYHSPSKRAGWHEVKTQVAS